MVLTDVKSFRKPDFDIDEIFINRWSPRSFSEKQVSDEILFTVFEAARWAPSAFNFQPWRFIIARTEEEKEEFYPFISEFNLSWCNKAPVLALIISETTNDDAGEFPSHSFDTGAAWGYLALQANKCGLITHPMTGFNFQKARETLEIPADFAIEALVAIGYQDEKEKLSEQLQQREQPNDRRPLQESIFAGKFGNEYSLTKRE